MKDHRSRPKTRRSIRKFEAESLNLQPLRLFAAPDPKDDPSGDELLIAFQKPAHSPDLIQHLIERIKAI